MLLGKTPTSVNPATATATLTSVSTTKRWTRKAFLSTSTETWREEEFARSANILPTESIARLASSGISDRREFSQMLPNLASVSYF